MTDYDTALARLSRVEVAAITPGEQAARCAALAAAARAAGLAAVWLDATTSLAYFTGLSLHPSERLHGALLRGDGSLVYLCPAFERPKLETMIRLPGEIAVWEEDEDPIALLAGLCPGPLALDPGMAFGFAARLMGRAGFGR